MHKITASLILASGLYFYTGLSFAENHDSELVAFPSFGLVQEMATVTADGDVLVDLYNTTGYRDMIRIGVLGGEALINPDSGNDAHGLGYKVSINQNIAAYGMLFLDNDNSFTNITGGASYTTHAAGFILNGNVEIFSQSDTTAGAGSSPSETFIDIRGSAYYRIELNSVKGSIYLGGDIDIEVEPDSNSDIYLAVRWIPKRNIVLDLGAYASLDEADVSTVGTPVFVRLNAGF